MNNKSKAHVKVHDGELDRRGLESMQRPSRHYADYMSDLRFDELNLDLGESMMVDIRDSGEYYKRRTKLNK